MRLLAISGSLRRRSYNAALLEAIEAQSPATDLVIWKSLDEIPAYNEDILIEPEPVILLKRAIEDADAVLFATPEYNGSVPGALKNALDWISRPYDGNPLRDKPVAVIGASQGAFGAVWAQAELRKILRTIGACVDEHGLAVAYAQDAFARAGFLRDPQQRSAVTGLVEALHGQTRRRAA